MKSWFVSDIHLKSLKERNGQTLLRFLFHLNKNSNQHRLFLLGDIFDFWVSDGRAFQNEYQELIEQIEIFKKNGGEAIYFEGNHDFHIDVFWTKHLNIPVIENEAFFQIEDLKVRLEHGDLINPDDKAYLKYRKTIRHPLVEKIGHFLPSYFLKNFGERQSQKSRKKTFLYGIENKERVIDLIRSHARRVYPENQFDLIITGHMHVYDDYSFESDGKIVRSINLGSWHNEAPALLIEKNEIKLFDLNKELDSLSDQKL